MSFDIFSLQCYNKRLPCLLLYSPEQLAAGRVADVLINPRKSGARYGLVSSFNCDRRFRFFNATSNTFPFCTGESSAMTFF